MLAYYIMSVGAGMRFTTSDGLSLEYSDEGNGIPVLCLPGITRNASDFDDLANVLNGVRLVRLTSRGRGNSDYDSNYRNYNVPREARDALELLEHLGIEKAIYVGTSRGGIVTMVTAMTAREHLLGAVLNDIGPEMPREAFKRIVDMIGAKPTAKNYDEIATELEKTKGPEFPDLTLDDWKIQAQRWFNQNEDGICLNYDPKIRDSVIETMLSSQSDLWLYFDAFKDIPIALLRGENTDFLDMKTVNEMKRRRPDMLYTNVPNRGHVPFLNEPEAVEVINALIERVKHEQYRDDL